MNERIKQLALECYNPYSNFDHEKFAELIVKECGQWIVDNAGAMEHLGPEYFAQAMIKEHFGIEQ